MPPDRVRGRLIKSGMTTIDMFTCRSNNATHHQIRAVAHFMKTPSRQPFSAESAPAAVHRDLLIVFTRFPERGKVKTRMIPSLGAGGACRLQREMIRHVLTISRLLPPDIGVEVHCDGGDERRMKDLFGADLRFRPQAEGDLGRRMLQCFRSAAERGAQRVVLVGTDCPEMSVPLLQQAFDRLRSHDCVLGPTEDGGYCLIGLRIPQPALFEGMTWGNDRVLAETLARAGDGGISVSLLARLHDVDRPEDLPIWRKAALDRTPPIAAVVPALDEENAIAESLARISRGVNVEPIVVDGGSGDRTAAAAEAQGARVLRSRPGRAAQMNTGAAETTADILLFSHADTHLPEGFDRHIREALADPRTAGGAFRLRFDGDDAPLRLVEWGANLRSRFLQLPYGDQGIFLWRADFLAAGGFPEIPIMEDAALVRALRKRGRLVTLPQRAVTSARRYRRIGPLSAWCINQFVVFCFLRGIDPNELAGRYRRQEGVARWLPLVWHALRGGRTRHN